MRSISTKLEIAVITCLIIVFGVISFIYAYNLFTVNRSNSEKYVWELCNESRENFDDQLKRMEMAVDLVAYHTRHYVDNSEEAFDLRMDKFQASAVSAAGYAKNLHSVFYCANPEYFNSDYNFFYVFGEDGKAPIKMAPRSPSTFEADTGTPALWFKTAAETQKPCWVGPYNSEVKPGTKAVTAYTVPIVSRQGKLMGVLGMELSLEKITKAVDNITLYQSGYVFLTGADGTILAHPNYDYGASLVELQADQWGLVEDMLNSNNRGHLIEYDLNGKPRMMAAIRLENQMVMVASVPKAEIDAVFMQTLQSSLIGFFVTIVITLAVIFIIIHKYIAPIKRLSKASQSILEGDMHVELSYKGKDEVGVLTQNFNKMAMQLNRRLEQYSNMAFRDGMTGVKNKASFDEAIADIDKKIGEGFADFGVIVADLNNLKTINDVYGHKEGDDHIKKATEIICRTFSHSPVFRIGGDEFVVLLERDDYINCGRLLLDMNERVEETNAQLAIDKAVSIACGFAGFEVGRDKSFLDVFNRADRQMYKNKRIMKQD